MGFEKLRNELAEVLMEKEFSELNEFQSAIIDAMKSGKHVIAEGHSGSGKSFATIISALQKVDQPQEGSPRAIIVCSDDQKARDLQGKIETIARPLDLTVDLIIEKGNMLQQRNDLFDGTEIIVATPKRLHDIYIQNGFNIKLLKLFVMDDADLLLKGKHTIQIKRIIESIPKCQILLTVKALHGDKLEEFIEENIPHYQLVEA